MSIRTLLHSWTREVVRDGAIFTHPWGAARGVIHVRDKQTLRPVDAWMDDVAGDLERAYVTEAEHLETAEGELAAVASVCVHDGRIRRQHTVGVVFGDDWCLVADAATEDARAFGEMSAIARTIAETTYLGLGERRRRRTIHAAPAGWTDERHPRATHYRPPEHLVARGLIIVDDAMPRGLPIDEEAERTYVLGGYEPRHSDEPATAVKVAGGALSGLVRWYRVHSSSGPVIGARAELADDRFLYRQHLFGRAEREPVLVKAFLELVFSVQPLPRPWARRAAPSPFYAD